MATKERSNSNIKFYCDLCNYTCSKKSVFNNHLTTRKHQMATLGNEKMSLYTCNICNKEYTDRTGLWKHKQKCSSVQYSKTDMTHEPSETKDENPAPAPAPAPDLVMMLVKQNQEFKDLIISQNNQIIELSKNGGMTNYHNTINNTNSHNKTFNLQFFLNETCKDAMNITDFVNSLKLTLQDLEKVGELGYAEGISRMFVRGLNDLDVTKRPIHCSDLKREILHIKDKDKWEKDDNQYKLKKAIKELSTKNIMLLDDWQKENPGCKDYNNQKNDIYLKMMVESLGPADDLAERKDFGKIIRTIAKNTIIAKED